MNMITTHFLFPISPILSLVAAAVGLIGLECLPGLRLNRTKWLVAMIGAIASLLFTLALWTWLPGHAVSGIDSRWLEEFRNSFLLDSLSIAFFFGIALFTFLTLSFLDFQFEQREERTEVFILTLFVASGMMILVSAGNLLMVFLGLELLSLPTYVLVGINRKDKNSCEAALKYFLFGSFATVLLVLGIALLYAQFGTLQISKISHALALSDQKNLFLWGALALLLIATCFKIGVVPFHMWVPDAYQGAPTSVTGFMGSAVKLAGFGLMLRLLWGIYSPLVSGWGFLLDVISVATMFIGNIAAIKQDNLKRLFAYSSISHAGYLLVGVNLGVYGFSAYGAGQGPDPFPIYYYLIVYGLMFLGLFAVIAFMETRTKSVDIYQLSGMGFTHPAVSLCLALFVLSMAGIPPTAGFLAKYFIFLEAVKGGRVTVVVLAVISQMVGVYYYLRIIVYLYMKESKETLILPVSHPFAFLCILLSAGAMVGLVIVPGILSGF